MKDKPKKMRLIDALNYLEYGVRKGFIDEDYAEELLDKPWPEVVDIVEEMIDRGDNYAESVIKGEL